ncbi:MAG TPA: hypothetical protein VK978_03475 [Candidatus Saccharimonadales bacterium]|nr:hypothetical protein [Candidatus Saccharimonadales bacterium]
MAAPVFSAEVITAPTQHNAQATILKAGNDQAEKLLVFPVAGILETRLMARGHFKMMKHWLGQPGVIVERPFAHPGLGLIRSVEDGYEVFERFMNRKLEQHDPKTPYLMVGHSYGGVDISRYHAEHGEQRPGSQAVAIGSPLGDMRRLPFRPRIFGAIDPYKNRCGEIADFVHDTNDLLNATGQQESLTVAGSTIDQMVPLIGSVPLNMNAQKVVFSQFGGTPKNYRHVPAIAAPLIEHWGMPMHPSVLNYLGSIATAIIRSDQPYDDSFTPDRAQYGAVYTPATA